MSNQILNALPLPVYVALGVLACTYLALQVVRFALTVQQHTNQLKSDRVDSKRVHDLMKSAQYHATVARYQERRMR